MSHPDSKQSSPTTDPDGVPLEYPITTAAGQKISRVQMRRAKVRDLRRTGDFGKTEAAQEVGLMAHLCGMTAEDFDELDAVDYRKLQEQFRGFLGLISG